MNYTQEQLVSPAEVAKLLEEYQAWRKGIGKYAWSEDPDRNEPIPFLPRELTEILNAAIEHLKTAAQ